MAQPAATACAWFLHHLPLSSPLVSTPTETILSEPELPDIGTCVVAADCNLHMTARENNIVGGPVVLHTEPNT